MLQNRKTVISILAALFIGVFCGYILGWYFGPTSKQTVQVGENAGREKSITSTSSGSMSSKLEGIVISDSSNVLISRPQSGDTISTPIAIDGLVRSFENRVHVRLRNKDGVEVRKSSFTATRGEVGLYNALSVDLKFAQPTVPQEGTLEVFTLSAKDGSETDKVIIPIKFAAHGGSGL